MELEKAFSRIEEIHGLVVRGEVFRGYRAMPVACTGLMAVCAMLASSLSVTLNTYGLVRRRMERS